MRIRFVYFSFVRSCIVNVFHSLFIKIRQSIYKTNLQIKYKVFCARAFVKIPHPNFLASPKAFTNCIVSILNAQSKWPFGQSLKPCSPQGRQGRDSLIWIIRLKLESGPKPNCGMVEQNIAATGASMADARCSGAESFT